jgi:hypothetical protein
MAEASVIVHVDARVNRGRSQAAYIIRDVDLNVCVRTLAVRRPGDSLGRSNVLSLGDLQSLEKRIAFTDTGAEDVKVAACELQPSVSNLPNREDASDVLAARVAEPAERALNGGLGLAIPARLVRDKHHLLPRTGILKVLRIPQKLVMYAPEDKQTCADPDDARKNDKDDQPCVRGSQGRDRGCRTTHERCLRPWGGDGVEEAEDGEIRERPKPPAKRV